MRRHLAYLKYVCRHKWYVYQECRVLGVPWLQAVVHDWSKFLPSEWLPYARSFYAPDGSKQYNPDIFFDAAWNSHQKRNKHHWQYWILVKDTGAEILLPIPERYIREMLADWVGAGRAIHGKREVIEWYTKNKHNIRLQWEARIMIEFLMKTHYESTTNGKKEDN